MSETYTSLSHDEFYVPLNQRGGYGGSVRPMSIYHKNYVPPRHEPHRRKENIKLGSSKYFCEEEAGTVDPLKRFGKDSSKCGKHASKPQPIDSVSKREVGWDERFHLDEVKSDSKTNSKSELPPLSKSDMSAYRADERMMMEMTKTTIVSSAPHSWATPQPKPIQLSSRGRILGPFPHPNQKSPSAGHMGIYRIPCLSPSIQEPSKARKQLPSIKDKGSRKFREKDSKAHDSSFNIESHIAESGTGRATPTSGLEIHLRDEMSIAFEPDFPDSTERAWRAIESMNDRPGASPISMFDTDTQKVQFAYEFLASTPLMKLLQKSDALSVATHMTPHLVDHSQDIVQQGEQGGGFFILYSGKCTVWQQNSEGEGRLLRSIRPGDYFGELSLLRNAPRSATVKSSTMSVVWRIDTDTFMSYIAPPMTRNRSKFDEFMLRRTYFGNMMGDYDRFLLIDHVDVVKYQPKESIIEQGSDGHYFYIIESGCVTITVGLSEIRCSSQVEMGGYFGEVSLLTQEGKRTANVYAEDHVVCLRWDRRSFRKYFRCCFDNLHERMVDYYFEDDADLSRQERNTPSTSLRSGELDSETANTLTRSDRADGSYEADLNSYATTPAMDAIAEEEPPSLELPLNFRSSLMDLPPTQLMVSNLDSFAGLDSIYENRQHSYAAE